MGAASSHGRGEAAWPLTHRWSSTRTSSSRPYSPQTGRIHQTLFRSGVRFHICETTLVDLFEHKERILRLTRLTADEVTGMYYRVLRRLVVFPEELVPVEAWDRAMDLCSGIDHDDVPHVALTLMLEGELWTGDGKLRRGLVARGFTRFFTPSEAQ